MAEIHEHAIVPAPQRPLVRWGGLFAGLAVIAGVGWLLLLLGSALGVGIADATDLEAVGPVFGWVAVVWFVGSWVVAYFVGSMVAARLAPAADRATGVLHGLTLWGLATFALTLIGYFGISGILGASTSLVGGAAGAAGDAVAGAARAGTGGQADTGESGAQSALVGRLSSELKREASRVLASASRTGARASEVDSERLQDVADRLAAGDREGAERALAQATDLSDDEISTIVAGAARAGDEGGDQAIEATLRRRVSSATARQGEAEPVDAQEVNAALEQLDAETLGEAAGALLAGDAQGAKETLAANTSLDEQEIDAIVAGVDQRVEQQLDEAKGALSKGVEAVSTYSQGVLWTAFVASLLGLVASLFGGAAGARAVRRYHAIGVTRTYEPERGRG